MSESTSAGNTPGSGDGYECRAGALEQAVAEVSLERPLPRCCQQVHAAVALLLNGSLRVRPERFEARVSFPPDTADSVARLVRVLTHRHVAIRHTGDSNGMRHLLVTGPAGSLPPLGIPAGADRLAGGLPGEVVLGKREHSAAAWRAALATRGSIRETARGLVVSVPCSTTGKALALVAAARRCGAHASAKIASESIVVEVQGAVPGKALLRAVGVSEPVLARLSTTAAPIRVDNLDSANSRRAREAAKNSCARVREALKVLAARSVPEHLLEAGHLRLRYPDDSVTDLAERTLEPTTPTVLAGRLRRLLELAQKHVAGELSGGGSRTHLRQTNPPRAHKIREATPARAAG